MSGSGHRNGKPSQVRIIGGQWRGRKLAFTPADGLRPTGDRIRETLFNWLTGHIAGARCADLFAGSGALGLEALSRGARHCDFVDCSSAAVAQVRDHLKRLDACDKSNCHPLTALKFLQMAAVPYDIVFIDPPFRLKMVEPICAALSQRHLLREGALVYVEMEATDPLPGIPEGWDLHREKQAGGVTYRLFSVSQSDHTV